MLSVCYSLIKGRPGELAIAETPAGLYLFPLRKPVRCPHKERHLPVLHTAAVSGLPGRGRRPHAAGHGHQRCRRGQDGAG